MEREKPKTFTKRQREWIIRRDVSRCQFHSFVGGKWVRCPNKTGLQVHHIIPRGWAMFHMPKDFEVNTPLNLLSLCAKHHVGRFSDDFRIGCVHPDTEQARLEYRKGHKDSYFQMSKLREGLNKEGIPYWNTRWDMQFYRICVKATKIYVSANEDDHYPNRGRGKYFHVVEFKVA